MNNKMLTIAALAAVLVAGVFATTPMAAYADGDYDDDGKDNGDYSGTETEQEIKQKNVGSDASTNVNCAENDIAGVEEVPTELELQLCGTAAVDLGTD
ncbi:MAG: hypothetical protein ACR2IS_13955 [Nitrososphaeraceae archaeon]